MSVGEKLSADQFVSRRQPQERFYNPEFTYPAHLLNKELWHELDTVISELKRIAGDYGQNVANLKTREFEVAAKRFQELTGVDFRQVVSEMHIVFGV